MAERNDKHPLNVAGQYYNDLSCIDCGVCPDMAPAMFRRDDEGGYSYLFRQPETEEEVRLARETVEGCPTESIGDDG
ncbi:MAG: ferredoxin [Paracoccaceae bacterium]|jgi:ferredoxin